MALKTPPTVPKSVCLCAQGGALALEEAGVWGWVELQGPTKAPQEARWQGCPLISDWVACSVRGRQVLQVWLGSHEDTRALASSDGCNERKMAVLEGSTGRDFSK